MSQPSRNEMLARRVVEEMRRRLQAPELIRARVEATVCARCHFDKCETCRVQNLIAALKEGKL